MAKREGGFLIAKIHQLGGRLFNQKLKEHEIDEINSAQGRILFMLWQCDTLGFDQLAYKTQLGKSTLTTMLDRLEKNLLIERKSDPNDRRKLLITRTKKDKALQKIYDQVSQEMSQLFYKNLSENKIHAFESTLRIILKNLEDSSPLKGIHHDN